jgi:hypothetical protein
MVRTARFERATYSFAGNHSVQAELRAHGTPEETRTLIAPGPKPDAHPIELQGLNFRDYADAVSSSTRSWYARPTTSEPFSLSPLNYAAEIGGKGRYRSDDLDFFRVALLPTELPSRNLADPARFERARRRTDGRFSKPLECHYPTDPQNGTGPVNRTRQSSFWRRACNPLRPAFDDITYSVLKEHFGVTDGIRTRSEQLHKLSPRPLASITTKRKSGPGVSATGPPI